MFLSAKKYLEDSAKSATSGADQLLTHTREIYNTVKVYEKCSRCNAQVSVLGNYLTSQNQCRMCSKLFCNACIAKSSVNVPNHLLDITFQNKTAHAQPERQFLCLHRCTPRVITACMNAFRKEITCRFEDYVSAFLSEEHKQHFFFAIPSASPEDTAYRKALRMIHIAGVVAGMTGYAMTYNAVKYAYYSSELVNILTEGGILGILTPLLESLKQCGVGITGPTAMMRLYYLGCYHTLQSKIDSSRRSLLYQPQQIGVLYSECPLPVLQYVNSYLSAAQWMYLSSLPPPHQDNDWGSWYLSQIIRRQGWSLLMCINESTKIPDGSKCPAFALVTRCVESGGEVVREAMLVIRGSNSIMDWSINLEDEMCQYVYTHVVDRVSWESKCSAEGSGGGGSSVGGEGGGGSSDGVGGVSGGDGTRGSPFNIVDPANTTNTTSNTTNTTNTDHYTHTVHGTIHKGLYTAATGLLEGYNLRTTLLLLLHNNYTVKVVGHSLGAGIAALIAAELRVTLIAQALSMYSTDGSSGGSSGVKSGVKSGDSVGGDFGASSKTADSTSTRNTNTNTTYPTNNTNPTNTNNTEPTSPTTPTTKGVPRPASSVVIPTTLYNTLQHSVCAVSAVIFSSPAFVSADLAEAMLEDRLLVNVVYDKDIIPRFSFKTIQVMAEELKDPDFCAQADKWTLLDKSDFSDYAVSMGKASDIHKPSYASAAEPTTTDTTTTDAGATATPVAVLIVGAGGGASSSGGSSSGVAVEGEAVPIAAPSKPFKPPKPSRQDSTTSISTAGTGGTGVGTGGTGGGTSGNSVGASGTVGSTGTTTNTSNTTTTTPNNTTNTTTTASGGSWSGFVGSLAATAIDKYSSVAKSSSSTKDTKSGATSSVKGAAADATSPVSPTTAPTTVQEQLDSTAAAAPEHEVNQTAAFVEQTAHAVGSGSSAEVKQKVPRAHTVTPGPIIHLYKENDGTVHAAVVTHEHASFQRMEIIPAHSADDHLMGKVREGMRSALFQHQLLTHSTSSSGGGTSSSGGHYSHTPHTTGTNTTLPTATVHTTNTTSSCDLDREGSAEVNRSQEERAKFDRYFNIPLHSSGSSVRGSGVEIGSGVKRSVEIDSTGAGVGTSSSGGDSSASGLPGRPNKVHRSITAENADSGTTTSGTTSGTSVVHSTKSSISTTGANSGSAAESAKITTDPSSTKSIGRAAQRWVNCSVCSLDVTWPYVLHSDASRAIVAHNCRKCGEVVCSLCAPAGDTVPGDGLNQSYQLQDYRVSLPERGLFAPQRVCVLCYFDT